MAYEVQKLVLFRSRDKTLTLADLVRVATEGALVPTASGLFVYVRADIGEATCAVRLSLASGPDVLGDARSIAEHYASEHPHQRAIADCDARIEVAWKPDEWDDVVDLVLALEPDLEALAQGITWFANVKELSEGSFTS